MDANSSLEKLGVKPLWAHDNFALVPAVIGADFTVNRVSDFGWNSINPGYRQYSKEGATSVRNWNFLARAFLEEIKREQRRQELRNLSINISNGRR